MRSLITSRARRLPGHAGGCADHGPPFSLAFGGGVAAREARLRSFGRIAALAMAMGAIQMAFAPASSGQEAPAQSAPTPVASEANISQAWPPPDHLFGDWGGLRSRLQDFGIAYDLNYTTENVFNLSGGLSTGAAFADQTGLSVDLDWQKLAGITGFSTHTSIVNRGGSNASADLIGDTVLQAQEIYGAGFGVAAKLVWFYGEQKLFDGRVDLAFGRLAPGADFNASPFYCNFMTLTICGHDRALTANQGFEDWPMSEWGARIRVRPTDATYIMVGVFQSQPFPTSVEPFTQGGHNGWNWTFKGTTGVSIPAEVAYEPVIGPDRMPGHYKLGYNWDTSAYPDNFYDLNGAPLALTGLPGKQHDGRGQFWATADQMVRRNGPNPNDGVILLLTYVNDQSNTTLFNNFVWAGVLDRGFWDVRPHDQIGFGFTYYDVSPRLTQTERIETALGLPLAGGARGVQTNAIAIEANYALEIKPGFVVQPELEYFIRPGATGAVPDAFLIGAKTQIDF